MNNYRKENGEKTTDKDPLRLMFYSASCGYYTDDWDKLKKTGSTKMSVGPKGGPFKEVETGGIPCCPICGCVGYQSTVAKWESGARGYETAGHPDYTKFLLSVKEKCFGRSFNFESAYDDWMKGNLG